MALFELPSASERVEAENLRQRKDAETRREMTEHMKGRAATKVEEAFRQNITERVQNGYRVTERDLENLKRDFKDADPANYASKQQDRLLKEATVEKLNSSLYLLANKADEATKDDYQKFKDEVAQAREQGMIGKECSEHYLKQGGIQENFYEAMREKELSGNSLERPGAYPEGRPEPPSVQIPDVCLDRESYMSSLVDPKDFPDPNAKELPAPEPAKANLPEDLQRLNEAVKESQERTATPAPAMPAPDAQHHTPAADVMKPDGSAREAELLKEQVALAKADAIANGLMPDPAKEKPAEPSHEQSELSKAIAEARAERSPAEHQPQEKTAPAPEHQTEHHAPQHQVERAEEPTRDREAAAPQPEPAKEKPAEPSHEQSELSKAISEARAEPAQAERPEAGRDEPGATEHQEKSAGHSQTHEGHHHSEPGHEAGEHGRDDMWDRTEKDDDDVYGRD